MPSLTVTPLVVTVLVPLPTFLSVYANVPPDSVSPLNSVPLATAATAPSPDVAVRLPSYVLLTLPVVSTKFAAVIVVDFVPPVKV